MCSSSSRAFFFFLRASNQENWLFYLLIPLLVTMELCREFSADRPRHAPRNIITSKTLQGLIRETLPTQDAKSNFGLSANVAWVLKTSGRKAQGGEGKLRSFLCLASMYILSCIIKTNSPKGPVHLWVGLYEMCMRWCTRKRQGST